MAVDISSELQTIRTGVYGEDIRMAIYDALKKLETGVSSDITAIVNKVNNLYDRFSTETYAEDLNDYVSEDYKYYLAMFDYDASTKHTPYSEGLVDFPTGCGLARFSAAEHGDTVQLAIVPGVRKIFMRTYRDSWTNWVVVASA